MTPPEAAGIGNVADNTADNTAKTANIHTTTHVERQERLHRLPAKPLETFVHETLARLAGRPNANWDELDPLLITIEVKPSETHLVLDAALLFGADHPDFAWDRLRSHLASGEVAVAEPGKPQRVRVRLPLALRFWGGSASLTGSSAHHSRLSNKPPTKTDISLVNGLRKAHAILAESGIDPKSNRYEVMAQAPEQSYQRKLCLLALLAPDVQRAILDGDVPAHVTLQALLDRDPPPLHWREQPAWLAKHA